VYLFFDTETGGLTPQYSLLTVSAILTDRHFDIIRIHEFDPGMYVKVKHANYTVHPKAMEVNQIDLSDNDANGFSVQEAAELFTLFIKEALTVTGHRRLVPAGHNVPFDVKFLQHYLLPEEKWGEYFTNPALDTCASARLFAAANKFQGGCNLDNLRKVFNIDTGVSHNAENDNLASIALAKKFVSLV
jgi:DNA polymerase III epsilon subunit-like protein